MESAFEMVTHSLPNLTEFRLPHVKTVTKLVERVPLFINRIGGSEMSTWEKIWITFFVLLPVCFNFSYIYTKIFYSIEEKDLHSFITSLKLLSFLPMTGCCIWYVWRNGEDSVTVKDMTLFDGRFRIEHGDTYDSFSSIWICGIIFNLIVRYVSALYWRIPVFAVVMASVWVVYDNPVCQMFLLKQMIVRRLQVVRKRIEQRDSDILAIFLSVRSLLKINNKVNEFYSPILFFWGLLNCITTLSIASDAWHFIVLGHGDPKNFLWISYTRALLCLKSAHLLTMFFRTSVRDEVHAIDHEMDRSISDHYFEPSDAPEPSAERPELRVVVKPLAERKKIFTLMEELMNTPTEATALDFFTVNAASLTSALGVIIDLVAFLIQTLR